MKRITAILSFLLIAALMAVQAATTQQFTVRFTARDSAGAGEPFATVRIYQSTDTAHATATGVTDIDGHFTQQLAEAGKYLLKVSAVGKATEERAFEVGQGHATADLGVIVMPTVVGELQEVTVTAQAPLVTQEIDRMNYNVQSDEEAKSKTIFELLRKVPLVTVDGQDNIKVRGSSDYKIYKNGHPDPTMSKNPKDVLKSIPASMIKRIEVITEPGAKYDAEGVGAILNIVTLESTSIKGVAGSVNAGVNQYGLLNFSGYLTTQIGKVTAAINYGYTHQPREQSKQHEQSDTQLPATGNEQHETSHADAAVNVHYADIEASYEPDTLNLLSLTFGGYYYDYQADSYAREWMTDATGRELYSYNMNSHLPGNSYYSLNGRVDFQHKTHVKDEALTLSYMIDASRDVTKYNTQFSDMVNLPVAYDGYLYRDRANFLEQTVQLDWTRPFATHNKVETGLKYINRQNRSHSWMDYSGEGTDDLDTDTRFKHITQVAAAYLSYTYKLNAWSARAGLRYEWSRLSASYPNGGGDPFHTNLSDWVPTASVAWMPGGSHSLKLAFATRINRPGISYLNPAVKSYVENVSYGNPSLKSVRNYSTTLTYTLSASKLTLQLTPSWSLSDGSIWPIKFAEGNKTVSTYGNVGHNISWDLGTYLQWSPTDKTQIIFNGGAGWEKEKAATLGLSASGWYYNIFANASQTLMWKLRLTLYGSYYHPSPDIYGHNSAQSFYGLSLQRSFLKDDRLTVRLSMQNPFNSSRYNKYSWYQERGSYTMQQHSWYTSQYFGLSVNWRFGSLKASVKKTDTTITNSDLTGGNSKR